MSPYSLFHELLFLSMLPPETRIRNRHGKTDPFSTDTNTIANNALHIKNLAMHTKIKRKSVERLKKAPLPHPPQIGLSGFFYTDYRCFQPLPKMEFTKNSV